VRDACIRNDHWQHKYLAPVISQNQLVSDSLKLTENMSIKLMCGCYDNKSSAEVMINNSMAQTCYYKSR